MAMYLGEDKVASLGSICNVLGNASKNLFDAYKYSENKTHTGNVSKYSVINPNEIEISYINGWSRLVLTLTGLEPNTDYTISAYLDKSNFSTSVGSGFYALDNYQDNAFIKGSGNVYFTFTSSSTGTFDMWFYGNWSGTNYSGSIIYQNIQLEKGSNATEYEKYFEPTILIRNSNGIFQEVDINEDNYSLEEQVVGTYLGKLLCKKTFEVTSPSQTSSSEIILTLASGCDITKYEGMLKTSNNDKYQLNAWFSATDYIYSYVLDSNKLKLRVSHTSYVSRPIEVTVWYTKN